VQASRPLPHSFLLSILMFFFAFKLAHAKSGKFVTVTIKQIAEIEKQHLRVVLDPEGSEGSWFVVTPRFKMRAEGDTVRITPIISRSPSTVVNIE